MNFPLDISVFPKQTSSIDVMPGRSEDYLRIDICKYWSKQMNVLKGHVIAVE